MYISSIGSVAPKIAVQGTAFMGIIDFKRIRNITAKGPAPIMPVDRGSGVEDSDGGVDALFMCLCG
ncbi:hypothetical protein PGT21_019352 [Puccinia graminis f. sp. tritici]|uniref:Uncharacterized protein n=1 Tax=Puccinia graminis f. sp. tritici TaxID=56615 RepID=A0A5B0PTT5_PUCGR|nr:hypothetical protein PGT21_019352 [Puccinia graminis f. sp. tritici]